MIWVQLPYSAYPINATLVKLADTQDLSSCFSNEVWVQIPQVVLRESSLKFDVVYVTIVFIF